MKNRKKRSKKVRILHLWNFSEVIKAVPYLRSIIGSLRESWLDVLNTQRQLERVTKEKKPSCTQKIIEVEARRDENERAQSTFNEALRELNDIDVFLLEPVKGLALVPFRKEDDLAWYVFDHFAPRGLIGWRYHSDPIEACRPLTMVPDAFTHGAVAS